MADLHLIHFADGDSVRCADKADAKGKAREVSNIPGRIVYEVTPEGGGIVTSLEYDRESDDWIAVQ
jgi:hypothetical protein